MSGIAMGENYSHLTLEERCRLCGMMEMGLSKAEIARRLGRARSIYLFMIPPPSLKGVYPTPTLHTARIKCSLSECLKGTST
jgi:hypothetical protein